MHTCPKSVSYLPQVCFIPAPSLFHTCPKSVSYLPQVCFVLETAVVFVSFLFVLFCFVLFFLFCFVCLLLISDNGTDGARTAEASGQGGFQPP